MNLRSCSNVNLIHIISELSQIKALRVTVKSCISSGLLVGSAATLGGLLFGPRGIAIGAAIAGVASSAYNEGQFRSVPDILMNDLTPEQTDMLANAIRGLLTQENIMTVAALSLQMSSQNGFSDALTSLIATFLRELNFVMC